MYNDLDAAEDVDSANTPLRSELIVPLVDQGVALVASTDPDAFDPEDRRLVELLCANTTAALDRTAREKTLRERER